MTADVVTLPLRLGVGLVIINPQGLILVGRRPVYDAPEAKSQSQFVAAGHGGAVAAIDAPRQQTAVSSNRFSWQLPQGGAEKGETLADEVAYRELEEETGLSRSDVSYVATMLGYTVDELPAHHAARKGWRRLEMQWILLRYSNDTLPDLSRATDEHGFDELRWVSWRWLLKNAQGFRFASYSKVMNAFNAYLHDDLSPNGQRH